MVNLYFPHINIVERKYWKKGPNIIGGVEYLSEVIDSVVSASNVDSYITIIREKALRRNLIKACEKIENKARDEINV